MNKKLNTEQPTRKTKNAECEKSVSLRHGLYSKNYIIEKINLNRLNCMNILLYGKPLLFYEIYKEQNDNKKHLEVE